MKFKDNSIYAKLIPLLSSLHFKLASVIHAVQ